MSDIIAHGQAPKGVLWHSAACGSPLVLARGGMTWWHDDAAGPGIVVSWRTVAIRWWVTGNQWQCVCRRAVLKGGILRPRGFHGDSDCVWSESNCADFSQKQSGPSLEWTPLAQSARGRATATKMGKRPGHGTLRDGLPLTPNGARPNTCAFCVMHGGDVSARNLAPHR